jgi:hypothetical protein
MALGWHLGGFTGAAIGALIPVAQYCDGSAAAVDTTCAHALAAFSVPEGGVGYVLGGLCGLGIEALMDHLSKL